jgi:DNA modification methylase
VNKDMSGYVLNQAFGDDWALYHGDSCEVLPQLPDEFVDLSIFSPPFSSLFTYSPTERDLGNSKNHEDFFTHFSFIIRELLRVTKTGRLCCIHVAQIPAMLSRDNYIGLKDFRGDVIRGFEAAGWIYSGEAVIKKNPQCVKNGTLIPTTQDFVQVENLQVGDMVIGRDGQPTAVIDIPYRGVQPIYHVTFDDGAWVECGPEHLWTVRQGTGPWKVVRTDEIAKYYEIPVLPSAKSSRTIRDVYLTGEKAPCTCISVAAPDGLYAVTKDYIITHNSQAIRTHSKALLFNQLHKDASWSRPALLDYILIMRKSGECAVPIIPDLTNDEWIYLAGGIWEDVNESDTLQYAMARTEEDDRHICPLQRKTIEHCIRLWSNPGEVVLSPFAGIGSEGDQAIRYGRKFVGVELKESYWRVAVKNLQRAVREANPVDLFSLPPEDEAETE